ncbi:hypothetical protein GDO86_017696 [Hymenochirus boettgeri]|uniref:Uncharacterized protein n=1 Tax=Hymenochirus boettgeri TaxID=247094 RepID=A0A8T2IR36_9PIPI|nr:hypothetical protein GDO86_017696 [Hymenochirus boettgeri]
MTRAFCDGFRFHPNPNRKSFGQIYPMEITRMDPFYYPDYPSQTGMFLHSAPLNPLSPVTKTQHGFDCFKPMVTMVRWVSSSVPFP